MPVLPENSRLAFIGDSLTHANNYPSRVIDYYRKNFHNLHVTFRNCGISGASVPTILRFFDEDILPFRPTHTTIMLGVNDSWRDLLGSPRTEERDNRLAFAFREYKKNLEKLCNLLKDHDVKVILCTPCPFAEHAVKGAYKGGHTLMLYYAEYVRKLAKKLNLDLIDVHARISELYLDEKLFGADPVHPIDAGYAHRRVLPRIFRRGAPRHRPGKEPEPISAGPRQMAQSRRPSAKHPRDRVDALRPERENDRRKARFHA
ncbi:MAG: SGNH/GDSL hydrolase family protein [Eubacteriales bacterium]